MGCDDGSKGSRLTDIDGLRNQAKVGSSYVFQSLKKSREGTGVLREVMSFRVDGLEQYALVLWPKGSPPASGWPLLLFNHGFHPDPANYGRIEGVNARPGKYYWALAQAYANGGYVVVVADYRGHNDSEAQPFSLWQRVGNWWSEKRYDVYAPAHWYTRDVVAAYYAAVKLPRVDADNVYMLGHSMGGAITQRSILALGDRIKAASVWSTSATHPSLAGTMRGLRVPLQIQHGKEDEVTRVDNSQALSVTLNLWQKPNRLIIVKTADHLFSGEHFAEAVARDFRWFTRFP